MQQFKVDGKLRTAQLEDIRVGTVFRGTNHDGSSPDWSDCTVVKVEDAGMVHLVRPYISQTEHGGWALQVEQFKVSTGRLLEEDCQLKVVLMSTGKLATTLR